MTTFNFGAQARPQQQQQQPSLFGNPAQGNISFNFGQTQPAATTAASTGFNFGQSFAATAPSSTFNPTLFSFGGPTSTTSTAPTAGSSTFNFTPNLGSSNIFGQQTAGFNATTPFSGSLFNQPRPTQFSFTTPLASAPQQQQLAQAPQMPTPAQLFAPKIYNDERDQVLAQFNRLMAYWGFGKVYYALNTPSLELNQNYVTNRFKTIGFAEIRKSGGPSDEERIGVMVKMEDENQLKTAILQYENSLKNMLGAQFNAKVETTKTLPESKVLLIISIVDTANNKKVPATQLISYLNQQHVKAQLSGNFSGFLQLIPLHPPSKQELEEYLNNPPMGIDQLLWNQAKLENPDPTRFIPVPLIGFSALNERFKLQEQETQQQKSRLRIISEDLSNLEREVTVVKAKIGECKRRNVALSNRVLKTMIWQEVMRKRGFPVQAEEDQLRAKIENIQSEINAPTKFKGCLNELMCRLRQMQSQQQQYPTFAIEEPVLKQIKSYLQQEQEGIQHLLGLLRSDISDLDAIKNSEKTAKAP